eukprot:IDg13222t1
MPGVQHGIHAAVFFEVPRRQFMAEALYKFDAPVVQDLWAIRNAVET